MVYFFESKMKGGNVEFVDRVNATDRNFLVTGQLFFREQASAMELDMTHRQIFGVCGIVAVPDECWIKPEHQYMLVGFDSKESGGILLGIDPASAIDKKAEARGSGIGSLLLKPWWKI